MAADWQEYRLNARAPPGHGFAAMTAALMAVALTGVAMLFGARTGHADWEAVLGLLVIFFGRFRSGFAIGTSN